MAQLASGGIASKLTTSSVFKIMFASKTRSSLTRSPTGVGPVFIALLAWVLTLRRTRWLSSRLPTSTGIVVRKKSRRFSWEIKHTQINLIKKTKRWCVKSTLVEHSKPGSVQNAKLKTPCRISNVKSAVQIDLNSLILKKLNNKLRIMKGKKKIGGLNKLRFKPKSKNVEKKLTLGTN